MEIAWYGSSCFRLRDRNTIALADPYLPDPKFQNLQIKTDLISVSQPSRERRNVVPNARKSYYVIDGPGEYEVGGIFVNAVWNGPNGRTDGAPPSLICTFAIDGVAICHLGQLEAPPSKELLEAITPVDVLIIPPGGRGKLSGVQAARIVSATSPKVVIPMEYAPGERENGGDGIDSFLREAGLEAGEPVSAISLSRTTLPDDKTETVLLESRTRQKKPAAARSLAQ